MDNNQMQNSAPGPQVPPPQMTPQQAAPRQMPPVAPPKKEKRIYSATEKWLLIAALAIAILHNRLLYAPLFSATTVYPLLFGAFWLCVLAIFYLFFWKKFKRNKVSWYASVCLAALCVWSFFFWNLSANRQFGWINYIVIPGVLMATIVYSMGEYKLKDAGPLAVEWLLGWFVKPFSALPKFFGALGSAVSGENKSTVIKVIVGASLTLPLLIVLLPLLSGADMAFGYHLARFFEMWNVISFIGHSIAVFIAFMFIYSFMWNAGFKLSAKADITKEPARIDPVICGIILGTINLLYVIFSAVQFTYLFGWAGLPGDMTYAEYARAGFVQTVVVCAINLLIFGIFLHFGTRKKAINGLLVGLLVLTGVMLFSGSVRLGMYINAYGLTWLRLISAWFMVYLAAVVIICIVRVWRHKLPAIALCALILLGWYVVLGYINPDGLITWYNQIYGF